MLLDNLNVDDKIMLYKYIINIDEKLDEKSNIFIKNIIDYFQNYILTLKIKKY